MALIDIRFGKRGGDDSVDSVDVDELEDVEGEMPHDDEPAARAGDRSRRGRRLLLAGAAIAALVYWRRRRSHRADAVEVTVDGETVAAR